MSTRTEFTEEQKEELREAFNIFDTDGDGMFSPSLSA